MPTYEYACRSCGEHLEVVQSFKDDALTTCPACQGELRKVFSAAGIIFKGSGWHVKDYAGKRPATASSGSDGDGSSSDAGSGSSGSDGDGGASGATAGSGSSSGEKSGSGSTGTGSDGASTGAKGSSGKADAAPSSTTSAPAKKSA